MERSQTHQLTPQEKTTLITAVTTAQSKTNAEDFSASFKMNAWNTMQSLARHKLSEDGTSSLAYGGSL